MTDFVNELRATAANLINGVIEDGQVPVGMLSDAADEIDRLHSRIELLESALKAIKRATLNGDVCNDVAWFDQIETLHDFCDRILDGAK